MFSKSFHYSGSLPHWTDINPFKKFLDSFKLKEFAGDIFKFDENSRKFSKREENNVGKKRNFSLRTFTTLPTLFLKDLYCRNVKSRPCLRKGKSSNPLTHYQTTNFRLFQTESVCRRQFQI